MQARSAGHVRGRNPSFGSCRHPSDPGACAARLGSRERCERARSQRPAGGACGRGQARLLLGGDVAHVAGGGLVRLDDAEAGVPQTLADRARKVAAAGQHHEAAREELRRDLGRQAGGLEDLGRQPPALGVLVKHAREAAAHLRARAARSPGRVAAPAPTPREQRRACARAGARATTCSTSNGSRRRQGIPAHARLLLPLQAEQVHMIACHSASSPAAVPEQAGRGPHQEPARHAHGILRDPLYCRRSRGSRCSPAADADRLAARARGLWCRSGQCMAWPLQVARASLCNTAHLHHLLSTPSRTACMQMCDVHN